MDALTGIPTEYLSMIALLLVTVWTIISNILGKKKMDEVAAGTDKAVDFMSDLLTKAKELGLDPVVAVRDAVADGKLTIEEAMIILTEINEGLGVLAGVEVKATVNKKSALLKKA